MSPLCYKDERIKIWMFIIIALIIEGVVFTLIHINSINAINKNIINNNNSIIGTIESANPELAKEIIPIITKNKLQNISLGEEILSDYSYNNNLKYYNNPLVNNVSKTAFIMMGILTLVTMSVVIFGVLAILNPLYKKLKYLTYRAENIVENKFLDDDIKIDYKGSLSKFELRFNEMEERIKNNLTLLQDEKINLKNIINDISHQLKTPLMALQMYNEILKDYKNMVDEEIENFILLSNEQLQRMEWLVKTLLKYARLESNVVEYHKDNISLNNTINESINPLRVKAEEKNQKIIFENEDEVIFYHDRKWISEAISNIIKNAIEHTGEKGEIEITLEETPINIVIIIKDNGEGIEKEQLKKIFNRFHKGENSIDPTSIGIGLCLSKAIVKAHNGDITVESKLGVGSIFYITFIKTIL